MTLIAAADGSALGNPGAAGWAWIIDDARWRTGGWKHATNNQAELMAVLSLLQETAATREPLLIQCDSQYVINALTKWLPGWKRKNWKKADGKPVMNRELLESLDRALAHRAVSFEWVKGHAGHTLNERADSIAQATARAFQTGRPFDEGPGLGQPPQVPAYQPFPDDRLEAPALFDATTFENASVPLAPSRDSVIELERILQNGNRHDTPFLKARLSADSVYVQANGSVVQGQESVAEALTLTALPDIVEPVTSIKVTPDVIHLLYRTASTPAIVCSSVWVRQQGEWVRALHQQTRES